MSGAAKGRLNAIRYVFTREVLRRNSLIALGVGCLLTLANQFDVLWSGPFTQRLGAKVFINFLVPFVVSSASAAMNRQPRPQ